MCPHDFGGTAFLQTQLHFNFCLSGLKWLLFQPRPLVPFGSIGHRMLMIIYPFVASGAADIVLVRFYLLLYYLRDIVISILKVLFDIIF